MDTVKERNMLEALWSSGERPWKIWNESHPRGISKQHFSEIRMAK